MSRPGVVRVAARQLRGAGRLWRRARRGLVVLWLKARHQVAVLPEWTGPATTRGPVFVGGTGRSGTTITAKVLGAHPAYHMIPIEIRFITDGGGLLDLLDGRTSFMQFEHRLLERWYKRLRLVVDMPTLRAAALELEAGLPTMGAAAAVRFVHRLLDGPALAAGAEGWIEMTPGNAREAARIAALWPEARFVHSVRDGRDVACSVVPLTWGPSTFESALEWWAASLEEAFVSCDALPAGRVRTVQMEALLVWDREAQFLGLLAFAGLADDPVARSWFEGNATAERSHVGRWRTDVPQEGAAAFDSLHDRLADGLRSRGRPYAPEEPGQADPPGIGES